MIEWTPIFVLPNVSMRDSIECELAALTGHDDARVKAVIENHPRFGAFLSKFKDQFGEQINPSILFVRTDAGATYFTPTAISAFRDLSVACIVPLARARRLNYVRPQPLAFSNAFAFYPWMLDREYNELVTVTPAIIGLHLLSQFGGQSYPEQPQARAWMGDMDLPLAKELLSQWQVRFQNNEHDWKQRALFRSLNMANEAARMPATTVATFYEFGRSLALWVSAFEILTHPGGEGEASIQTVFSALEKVGWVDNQIGEKHHATGKKGTMRNLACHVYERVYSIRNDFLHGNDVSADQLVIGKKHRQIIDYAACLYRLALASELNLGSSDEIPSLDEPKELGKFLADHMAFEAPQVEYEEALETFLAP
jgi:hypothetical protein